MSVDVNITAGLRRLVSLPLTTTSAVDVLTATDANSTVVSAMLVNETSTAATVSLFWLDATGPTTNALYRTSVPADDTVMIDNLPVRLRDADKITAQADTSNAITVNLVVVDSFNYRPETLR